MSKDSAVVDRDSFKSVIKPMFHFFNGSARQYGESL